MRIGVDIDGVVYNWHSCLVYILNTYRGYHLPPFKEWWDHWYAIKDRLAAEDWRWVWDPEGATACGLWRHGHLIKGAIEGLQQLKAQGHTLLAVTSRPAYAVPDTLDFFSYHKLPFQEVYVLSDKPKSSVDFDLLVDDNPEFLEEACTQEKRGILFRRPWNKTYIEKAHIMCASSWPEVVKLIGTLSE